MYKYYLLYQLIFFKVPFVFMLPPKSPCIKASVVFIPPVHLNTYLFDFTQLLIITQEMLSLLVF